MRHPVILSHAPYRSGDSIRDVIYDSQYLGTYYMNTPAEKIQINLCAYGKFFSSLSGLGCIHVKKRRHEF